MTIKIGRLLFKQFLYLFFFNMYNLPNFSKTHFNKKTVRLHFTLTTLKVILVFFVPAHLLFSTKNASFELLWSNIRNLLKVHWKFDLPNVLGDVFY